MDLKSQYFRQHITCKKDYLLVQQETRKALKRITKQINLCLLHKFTPTGWEDNCPKELEPVKGTIAKIDLTCLEETEPWLDLNTSFVIQCEVSIFPIQ